MKKIIVILATILILSGCSNSIQQTQEQELGISYPNSKWIIIDKFDGYQTKYDETKIADGANGRGQNTTANSGDRISIRQYGTQLFPEGEASTTQEKITSIHNFRKKDGENIMMRTHGSVLEFYDEYGDRWEILNNGYTPSRKFGFADYNQTLEETSYVYFGNGVEDFSRWTGVHTNLTQDVLVGTTTIHVVDAGDFPATGNIVFCGKKHAYTAKTTTTFTIATTTAADVCNTGRAVAEAVETYAGKPKGNIYATFDNRLLIAGITGEEQSVYFSRYGDPLDFIGANLVDVSTDDAPDIFNLVEGGGSVTGLAVDENTLYIFKKSIIYKVSLTDTDYSVTPLKSFDGKSQTTGCQSLNGIFTGGNQVFFVTPDNQIMALLRVENIDYPQIVPISDIIRNTVKGMDFSNSRGIVFQDKAYFTAKQSPESTYNDVVLVWNIKEKMWDSPLIGWNVEDFVVYDDGYGEKLYYADAISPNVYKVVDEIQDDIFEVKANWRSKQFDFGMPAELKQITDFFVEGYITDNTTLTISLLLDEDGYTQTFSTDISGTDTQYIYNSTVYNIFGLTPFGTQRFGSSDISGLKKFRVYLGKNFRANPFYNLQVEFGSEGANENWEITRFGFKVRPYTVPEKRELYKSFQ